MHLSFSRNEFTIDRIDNQRSLLCNPYRRVHAVSSFTVRRDDVVCLCLHVCECECAHTQRASRVFRTVKKHTKIYLLSQMERGEFFELNDAYRSPRTNSDMKYQNLHHPRRSREYVPGPIRDVSYTTI